MDPVISAAGTFVPASTDEIGRGGGDAGVNTGMCVCVCV